MINEVLFYKVRIWNKKTGQWISKVDAGTKSNTETEKFEASDSFKSGYFNCGIGRELYTTLVILVKATGKVNKHNKFKVKKITIDNTKQYTILTDKQIKCLYAIAHKKGRTEA